LDLANDTDCIARDLIGRASQIVRLLLERKLTVVTAESCTAGLVAAALAQGEGASDVLHGGFVTYTKAQKSAALGVAPKLLARQGSVNAAVAEALAAGALERSPADIAFAVTGVLGPAPGAATRLGWCISAAPGVGTALRSPGASTKRTTRTGCGGR
jgi:nicotinamide-nucleotide amidase